MEDKINQDIKNIDYIRLVADLSKLNNEQKTFVAGFVKGLAIKKNLSNESGEI